MLKINIPFKKIGYIILFVTVCLLAMLNAGVSATSWEEMKPQVVSDRAEVIVIGKYNFSSKQKPSDFVFQGLEFNATKIYKGDVPNKITAGIDYNDHGWAEDFQNNGGEFLLFLEKEEEEDFLIPVGGPNGMIQIVNGEVQLEVADKRDFYENILKAQPKESVSETRETKKEKTSQKPTSPKISYVIIGVIVGIGIVILFLKNIRNKR